MAVKGLDIFKLSPKTNCKECGSPTCMAFCMKVAQGAISIDKCPHMSAEAIALLSEATAPPMKSLEVGAGDNVHKLGGETVLFRHEKTLVSKNLFAVPVCTGMDDATVDAKLADMAKIDYERIGDYVVNLSESATALHTRGITFSDSAKQELNALTGAVGETLDKALACYSTRSRTIADQVEPLEEVVDLMQNELKNRHIERLKSGECTIELGTQYLELLINLERISDHCSNVALYIIRETSPKGDLVQTDTHAYLHNLHHGGDEDFDALFAQYRSKYYDPIA